MKLGGLRHVRRRRGLSIGQLAQLSGLRRELIFHLERGIEDAQPYMVKRLASLLAAGPEHLMGVNRSGNVPTAHRNMI